MKKGRLEAFSDGVIAIIITIMVLELKIPHNDSIEGLKPLFPVFVSYVLSFIYIGIYWNNHHHMMQASKTINGKILWANMHLLFWLSLIPFVTGWMGENHFTKWPVALYGLILFMNAVAYTILSKLLIKHHGAESMLNKAIGIDIKGKVSILLYLSAMLIALINAWVSLSIYIIVAIMWIIPDTRIEKRLVEAESEE
ncbi:TMEM175 family protein [Pedobacter sp. P351]|uniref:TMEM175 family protein n=1 Tax=Pedobacter superstes TaxID=3133441 RepID=UPI0030B61B2D